MNKKVYHVNYIVKCDGEVRNNGIAYDYPTPEEALEALKTHLKNRQAEGKDVIICYINEWEYGENCRDSFKIVFYRELFNMPAFFDIDKMTMEDPFGMYTYKMKPEGTTLQDGVLCPIE